MRELIAQRVRRTCGIATAIVALAAPSAAVGAELPAPTVTEPATACRYVPERSDDFAWENDLVAFRTYGPALRAGKEDSGIDCWAKRVPYPIIDRWYRLHREQGISYHQDHGEGADFYHVGSSRGCGGTAIWHDGAMVLSDVYRSWVVLEQTPSASSFRLVYSYQLGGRTIQEQKTISIHLGERFFRSESVFTEDGRPVDLEVAIGLTTHNQAGAATLAPEAGWMAVWETISERGFGTGVVVDPQRLVGMREIRSQTPDESHAVAIVRTDAGGRTVHRAGFAWDAYGEVTTARAWEAALAATASSLATDR